MFGSTLSRIDAGDTSLPLKCDIAVLEKIQDEFGNLSDFENKLTGFTPAKDENGNQKLNDEGKQLGTYSVPDLKALKNSAVWMIQEGMAIERDEGVSELELSDDQILRKLDYNPYDLAIILHDEFAACFARKNPRTPKNGAKTKKQ